MAKGQVSEEELSKGLKGIGNFSGLNQPRVRRDNPFGDSRLAPRPEPAKTFDVVPPAPEERTAKPAPATIPTLQPKSVRSVSAKKLSKVPKGEGDTEEGNLRKADVFTERVTLQMSPAMRDEVERLARELQRAKISKKERITGNTVMRVAVRLITEHFELKAGEAPNDEEELFEYVASAFKKR